MTKASTLLCLSVVVGLLAMASPSQAQATFPNFRMVVVGPVAGDPVASGTRLLNALASINPASCPGENWLLWVAPGVYDLGTSSLVMKPCVDIEGAGERATKITAAVNNPSSCAAGTVMGASNAELRLVTVESTGSGVCAAAFVANGASPRLTQVALIASAGGASVALSAANAASLTLMRMSATASGTGSNNSGMEVIGSSLTATDVTVVASGAMFDNNTAILAQSSTLIIHRSRLAAFFIINDGGGVTARVAHSQLEGAALPTGMACIGNYNASFAPVTCP